MSDDDLRSEPGDSQPDSYPLLPIGEDLRELGADVPAAVERICPVESDRIVVLLFMIVSIAVGSAELGLGGPTLTSVTGNSINIVT